MKSSKIHYFAVLAFLLALGLLAWTSYAQALKFEQVNSPLSEKLQAEVAGMGSGVVDVDISYDIEMISESTFFKKTVKQQPKRVVAQKTRLKLTLEGIIAAEDSKLSRAVIRSNNKVIAYQLGDKIIETNAELNAVESNRVLIDRAGVLESLELDREKVDLAEEERNTLLSSGDSSSLAKAQLDSQLQAQPVSEEN